MGYISKRLRFAILARDQFACQYCGRAAPSVVLHVDHVLARAEGGGDDPANLVAACADCNGGKSDRSLGDATLDRIAAGGGREPLNLLAAALSASAPEDPWGAWDPDIVNALLVLSVRAASMAEWKRDVADLLRGIDLARTRGVTLSQLEDELDVVFGNG